MKSNQFCSVCKEWLDMEVVPTSDGEEDDGVIWFRCPQCQGFLPKLSGSESGSEGDSKSSSGKGSENGPAEESGLAADDEKVPGAPIGISPTKSESSPATSSDESLPWDSPADMMAARENVVEGTTPPNPASADLVDKQPEPAGDDTAAGEAPKVSGKKKEDGKPAEPIHEYIALLAEKDQGNPTPYRPWETYEVGQCILHQAWEDCGVVVAKESLPGGREVIKCFFAETGVVRLIEKAPR